MFVIAWEPGSNKIVGAPDGFGSGFVPCLLVSEVVNVRLVGWDYRGGSNYLCGDGPNDFQGPAEGFPVD